MFEWCITIGFSFILVATFLAATRGLRKQRRPNITQRTTPNTAFLSSALDEPWELNLDAFDAKDLAREAPAQSLPLDIKIIDDDEPDEHIAPAPAPAMPSMTLASLIEIQRSEALSTYSAAPLPGAAISLPPRPKVLGDEACELGVRYFDYLLKHHVIPRGARHLTNDANILIAENALKTSHASATLSHGAVAQRIGERAVCLFEPLLNPVLNVQKALEQLSELFNNKTIFIILSSTENTSDDLLAHIAPLCKQFHIPKTCVFIEQPSGAFANYIEDAHDFVPERLDIMQIPQTFFEKLLDYAHHAYDEGDHEAVLRSLAPMMGPLSQRIQASKDFPAIMVAQALNLVGMTYRDIDDDDNAIAAFDRSLQILNKIEDYEAIKSVKANLGITLALSRPMTLEKLEAAIFHLNQVTQLNPRDDEAWLYLANSYLELYRINNKQSLMGRALRAYQKAYELNPGEDIASCIEALQRQINGAAPHYGSDSANKMAPTRRGSGVSADAGHCVSR